MDNLYVSLGKFYFTSHLNSPPTFLQVIGWTKGAERAETKRRYVYVRRVPLINRFCAGVGGGEWEFDNEIIKKYASEIKTPVHKSTAQVDNAILIDGAHFLRYQSITVPQREFDFAPVHVPEPTQAVDFEELTFDEPRGPQLKRLRKLSTI